jgi:hypothetical protein
VLAPMHSNCNKASRRLEGSTLSLQISQRIIQFHQVRVQPVKAWAPVSDRLFRGNSQHGEIAFPRRTFRQSREVLAKKCGRVLADHAIAFIYGEHRSQHPLILGMRLAKVEVWHTCESSTETRETLIVRKSLYWSESTWTPTPSCAASDFLPDFRLISHAF